MIASLIVAGMCSWAHPGVNPMQGSTVDAVAHYDDIPAAEQDVLRDKMRRVQPDAVVRIYKDRIRAEGQGGDFTGPYQMHFGAHGLCDTVTMPTWADDHYEVALVYCAGESCLLVPRICLNVSRVYKVHPVEQGAPLALISAPGTPDEPIAFEVPAAPAAAPGDSMSYIQAFERPTYALAAAPLPTSFPQGNQGVSSPSPTFPAPVCPIPAVPEPATWVLIVLGIAFIQTRKFSS